MREDEDAGANADAGAAANVDADEGEKAEAGADADGGNDPRGREGAQRKAVNVVDIGSAVGDAEAAGQRLGREWDEGVIHRGESPLLLTMTGQSTDVVAWCRAGLGPWLGSLYMHVHYMNAVDTRWAVARGEVRQRGSRKLAAAAWSTSGEGNPRLGNEPSRGAGKTP
jgi:hypothetical protein